MKYGSGRKAVHMSLGSEKTLLYYELKGQMHSLSLPFGQLGSALLRDMLHQPFFVHAGQRALLCFYACKFKIIHAIWAQKNVLAREKGSSSRIIISAHGLVMSIILELVVTCHLVPLTQRLHFLPSPIIYHQSSPTKQSNSLLMLISG
jgi:hypothetical protein